MPVNRLRAYGVRGLVSVILMAPVGFVLAGTHFAPPLDGVAPAIGPHHARHLRELAANGFRASPGGSMSTPSSAVAKRYSSSRGALSVADDVDARSLHFADRQHRGGVLWLLRAMVSARARASPTGLAAAPVRDACSGRSSSPPAGG